MCSLVHIFSKSKMAAEGFGIWRTYSTKDIRWLNTAKLVLWPYIYAKTSTHHDGVWVSLCTTCKENKTRSVNEVESLSWKLCAVSISSQSFETRRKPFHLSERGKKGRFFGTRGGGLPYKSERGRNRRFWPHLGYCYESQYFHPIKVSLSVGRLEISILKKISKKWKKKRRNEMES